MSVRQQYRREYGKGLPHKKPIASETDARKMKSSVRLGGLKEAPASIGGEYFTRQNLPVKKIHENDIKSMRLKLENP